MCDTFVRPFICAAVSRRCRCAAKAPFVFKHLLRSSSFGDELAMIPRFPFKAVPFASPSKILFKPLRSVTLGDRQQAITSRATTINSTNIQLVTLSELIKMRLIKTRLKFKILGTRKKETLAGPSMVGQVSSRRCVRLVDRHRHRGVPIDLSVMEF